MMVTETELAFCFTQKSAGWLAFQAIRWRKAMQVFWPQEPRFGSKVGMNLNMFGFPQHVGIYAPHPFWGRSVISFTPSGIMEEPDYMFRGNKFIFDSVEYPSNTPEHIVIARARTAVNKQNYDLFKFNCDYFVRYCHGLSLESPQVNTAIMLGLIGAGLLLAVASQK